VKFFRVAVATAALALLGTMAVAEAPTKWTRYEPSGDGYRIEFPGTPTVVRDTTQSRVGPAPHVKASLNYAHDDYSVDLTTYASASDPEAVLGLFSNTVAATGKVRTQTDLKVGTAVARRFEIEMQGGQVVATMLVTTDGTRVFQVLCITLKGREHSANVKHFINSFALVP